MKLYQNREWLYQKYWIEELNPYQIAKLCNADHKTIRTWLKKFNISIRSISEATKIAMNNPKIKKKISIASKKMWANPDFKEKHKHNKYFFGKIGHVWNKDLKGEKYKLHYPNGFSIGNLGKIPWNKGKKFPQVTGVNNHNWKGGITPLIIKIRSYKKYDEWRKKIYERDNFTCQMCEDNRGHNLQAHHKKSFAEIIQENDIKNFNESLKCKELWSIDNGVTLCKDCHKKIHSNKLTKPFQPALAI